VSKITSFYGNNGLCGDNSTNKLNTIIVSALNVHTLTYMHVPSLISIYFSLFKIWPGQATIMKTWLMGENKKIQDGIIDIVH